MLHPRAKARGIRNHGIIAEVQNIGQ